MRCNRNYLHLIVLSEVLGYVYVNVSCRYSLLS